MAHGKNINVFLMDNTPVGRIKCTLSNWTGTVYKIPRTALEKCNDRDDLKQSGVYFLFGTSDETEKPLAYIGQAGTRKNEKGILYRLFEHRKNDYWNEVIVFTTSNNSFGPTEISFLENKFYNLAMNAHRYELKNENEPTQGNITEEKESELEEFTEKARIIMGVLGHKIFEPLSTPISEGTLSHSAEETTDVLFRLSRRIRKLGRTIEAKGKRTAEGFVVLQGSCVSPVEDETISAGISKRRRKARISNGILLEDMLFSSPSAAAKFLIGQSTNGLMAWKTENGITLKEYEKMMLK